MYYYEIYVCHCYIVVNFIQKVVVEIINVKAQAVFYLFICLGGPLANVIGLPFLEQ